MGKIFKLLDYQNEAIDNIYGENGLFNLGKRFATVILPTGGGKSFVAMEAMLRAMNLDLDNININSFDGDVVSNTGICYLAPNKTILEQVRLYLTKYIISECYLAMVKNDVLGSIDDELINQRNYEIIYRDVLGKLGIKETKIKKLPPNEMTDDYAEMVRKTIDLNICELNDKALDTIVKSAFPKLDLRCYQKSNSKKEESLLENVKADFMIIDEAHRVSAESWKKALKNFVKKHKETRFLAITATPERNNDDENYLDELAGATGYSNEEILEKKYIAKEIYLIEAIKQGIVTKPTVKYFPCMLDETDEYLEVLKKYIISLTKTLNNTNVNITQAYKKVLQEMHRTMQMEQEISDNLLEFSSDDIEKILNCKSLNEVYDSIKSPKAKKAWQSWQETKRKEIEKTIYGEENDCDKKDFLTGKYIAFIPSRKDEKEKDFEINTDEFISDDEKEKSDRIIKKIKDWLKTVLYLKNNKSQIEEIFGVESIGSIQLFHSKNDERGRNFEDTIDSWINLVINKDLKAQIKQAFEDIKDIFGSNNAIFNSFNKKINPNEGMRILLTNKKVDEGFHPDGIRGLLFFEQISEKENENKRIVIEDTPIIRFWQKIGRCIRGIVKNNKKTNESLNEDGIIYDFACNFGRHRKALENELGDNIFGIPKGMKYFFELADMALNAPIIGFGERKIAEGKKEIPVSYDFQVKIDKKNVLKRFEIKDWEDLYSTEQGILENKSLNEDSSVLEKEDSKKSDTKKVVKKHKIKKASDQFDLLIKVIEELENFDITYNDIKPDSIINKEELKKMGLSDADIKKFYIDLAKSNWNVKDINIELGDLLDSFRKAFWRDKGVSKLLSRVFDDPDIDYQKLVKYGIISVDLGNIPNELKDKVNDQGFILPNEELPEHSIGINIKTGTHYDLEGKDEFGCFEKTGRDEYGYDRYGFDENGYHKITRCRWDERFFRRDKNGNWINCITKKEVDLLGYNHDGINPQTGFDRGELIADGRVYFHKWHQIINGVASRVGKVFSEDETGKKLHDFLFFNPKGRICDDAPSHLVKGGVYHGNFLRNLTNKIDGKYFCWSSEFSRGLNVDGMDEDGFIFRGKKEDKSGIINAHTSSYFGINGKRCKIHSTHPFLTTCEYPSYVINTVIIINDILKHKSAEEIRKLYPSEDYDNHFHDAFCHFLMFKDAMMDDMELIIENKTISTLISELKNNKEALEVIQNLSPKTRKHFEIITKMNERERRVLENKRRKKEKVKEVVVETSTNDFMQEDGEVR